MRHYISSVLLSATLLITGCQAPQVDRTASAQTQTVPVGNIQYAFSQANQHPEKLLIDVVNSANKTLDIAIYSLTKQDIVDAVIAAKKRGVKVRIITDTQQAGGKSQKAELKLIRDAGIPIKKDAHSGLMHMKVTVADGNVVTTGSYNYTENASTDNDEVLVVIRDSKLAKEWTKEFDAMWNDNKKFQNWK